MPPKVKLHKSTGLSKNLSNMEASTSSGLSPEMEQQFEVELCWCIQQLQMALKSNKLNNKQIQDHTKTLNTLMSNSAPMVKKRQVMRLSFGDYRAKMAAEDKKHTKNVTNMKVVPASPSKKSVFVKKCAFSSSGNTFKFNFKEPTTEDSRLIEQVDSMNVSEHKQTVVLNEETLKRALIVPSENNFRFNFNVDA